MKKTTLIFSLATIVLGFTFQKAGAAGSAPRTYLPGHKYLSNRIFKTENVEIPRDTEFTLLDVVPVGDKLFNRFVTKHPQTGEDIPVSIVEGRNNMMRSPGEANDLLMWRFQPDPRRKSECSPRDLRDKFGPPRKQGKNKWCAMEAVGDYLSFRLGRNVSIPDLAIRTHLALGRKTNLSKMEGVDSVEVLQVALSGGTCLDVDFPSQSQEGSLAGSVEEVERIHSKWKSLSLAEKGEAVLQLAKNTLANSLRGKGLEDFEGIFQPVASIDSLELLRRRSCGKMRNENTDAQIVYSKAEDGLSALDEQLDKYHPAILQVHSNEFLAEPVQPDTHGMTVIARRPGAREGQCEYFLRNSRGRSCESYGPKIECDEEHGGIWVSASLLKRILIETNYLSP